MRVSIFAWVVVMAVAGAAPSALAQDELGGSADVELGATQPSSVELGAGTGTARPRARLADNGPGSDQTRLGLQMRYNMANLLDFVSGEIESGSDVPFVTPGLRLAESRLFVGVGLGLGGFSREDMDGDETGRSGFTVSPLASYDILFDEAAALSLLGWLNLASLGETEDCDADGSCMEQNDDEFGWGLNLGAGVRGFISEGLSIGGEFGWGFMSRSQDVGSDLFAHGLFGNLLVEASVGL